MDTLEAVAASAGKEVKSGSSAVQAWSIAAFTVIVVGGLFYAKWQPYYHKAFLAAAKHSIGGSIISGHASAPPPASWHAAVEYAFAYGKAIWQAMIVGLLVAASVLAAWMSEILVGAVEGASKDFGVSKLFIGLVVLAVVGGAAELGSAVMMGRKNRMDLALGIALGSSAQIALFVAPLLVLLSFVAAPQPFVLAFTRGEIALVFVTIMITAFVGSGGKTHWYKSVQLLTVYFIFALLFCLITGK